MSMQQYNATVARLARAGVKDPTAQIIFLAEEIEIYREKIKAQEKTIKELTKAPPPKKLECREPLDRPYIELRPTCSECGAVQENVSIAEKLTGPMEWRYYQKQIKPAMCKKCGAVFGHIVFQGKLPGEEGKE